MYGILPICIALNLVIIAHTFHRTEWPGGISVSHCARDLLTRVRILFKGIFFFPGVTVLTLFSP